MHSSPFRLILFALSTLPVSLIAQTREQTEFFEKHVRPVLARSCQGCHNSKAKASGLDLASAEGFLHGGQAGPLVSKDDRASSRLLKVISYDEKLKMPPMGKLKDEEIARLTEWVKMGAPWPGAVQAAPTRPKSLTREFTDEERKFWAFQPVKDPEPPAGKHQSWVKSPIDRFILAKLEEKGLTPDQPASKLALLRRATFDLTGLPPTVGEIEAFLADNSPDAFAKVIDRLLASPRYGEHWGRHWLDVARYADSTGNDEDHRYPYGWRYRDYVIKAFNDDLPYDQFVREQIAGDLLPSRDGRPINREGIVATGFLALGAKALAQQDKQKMIYDIYDEQIDVTSKAFLGLSLSCARCHDHKFDPLLTRDYYSLAGIFASTKNFSDAESHVSKLLYTPLVPESKYKTYRDHQDLLDTKKLAIDDVAEGEMARYSSELAPRVADFMLATAKVRKGADVAATAAEAKLDAALLKKWVAFLTPGDYVPPHLEKWMSATPAAQAAVAAEYQQDYNKSYAVWSNRIQRWREAVMNSTRNKDMPPPRKPDFNPESGPFFHAVYFGKGPFAVPEKEREKVFRPEAIARIAELKKELEQLKASAPPEPDMACAVSEGKSVEQRVFIRGDYGSLGEVAPKAFPKILARAGDPAINSGSGRLELAQWLTRPEHPLTARVMVNRIWQWHFGEGIVRTPDNFGKMGDRPSHPELLDYLAARFVEQGWSVKKMHRLIMLSNAYQMSSEISGPNFDADPDNRLLSRFHRRRLAVEEMRDGMLAINGSIDLTMGGTLQTGFGTDSENSNDRLSLNPEKIQRRMVYLPLRRANLPSLLNLFDFGDATTPSGKRVLTNVAPQALFAMNSGMVADISTNLATQALQASDTDSARLERIYLKTLNRKPDASEVDSALTYIRQFEQRYGSLPNAWSSFCRILLASNEFIYVD